MTDPIRNVINKVTQPLMQLIIGFKIQDVWWLYDSIEERQDGDPNNRTMYCPRTSVNRIQHLLQDHPEIL